MINWLTKRFCNPNFVRVGSYIFKCEDVAQVAINSEKSLITVIVMDEFQRKTYSMDCDSPKHALEQYEKLSKKMC